MLNALKIATLNARSIDKMTNQKATKNLHKYLGTLRLDILVLQETNIRPQDSDHILRLDNSLRVHQSIWTSHCALLLLNPKLTFLSSYVLLNQRAIMASIGSMDKGDETLFDICTLYAPSGARGPRNFFYNELLQQDFFQRPSTDFVILGDFNYHHHLRHTAPAVWKEWINDNTINIMSQHNGLPIHTFNNQHNQSTIDYIFMSPAMAIQTAAPTHTYLARAWTDHTLLSCEIRLGALQTGPGVWRMNTTLLDNEDIKDAMSEKIIVSLRDLAEHTPIEQWDQLKIMLQEDLQKASRQQAKDKKDLIHGLQRDRQHFLQRINWLKGAPVPSQERIAVLEAQWENTEHRLDTLMEKTMTGLALRTQLRWREMGERCTKYFFRVLKARAIKRTITQLRVPNTNAEVSDPADLCRVGRTFYNNLYTPDPISQDDVTSLLSNIPAEAKLTETDQAFLTAPISTEEINACLKLCAKQKVPGMDGFPFELYHFLLEIDEVAELLTTVMNSALTEARIPASWLQTCMILLHKKGDAADLGNWRPLSLINTDSKIFTKIIATRLNAKLGRLITPLQTGFVQGRRISDNGFVLQAFLEYCQKHKVSGAGILFDQEKAYDRVHPEYLKAVMKHMDFPDSFVDSIFALFFGTNIHLNINGYLAQSFEQQRGLRQGDPLSPLLFNIAFEPLLQTIMACADIQGVRLSDAQDAKPLKEMAYADDLLCIIQSADEWNTLKEIMHTYGRASNARLNLRKTVAFPLHNNLGPLQGSFQRDGVQTHSKNAEEALIYLGFPIALTPRQRNHFFNSIHLKIKKHISLLGGRQLSVLGRGTIANSLLLSRLWHAMTVHSPSQAWTKQVQSTIRKYVVPFFPAPSWDHLCLRRSQGGLGLVDIKSQSLALQLRAVQRICSTATSFMATYFKDLLSKASQSEHPLAAFADPELYLERRQRFLECQPTLKRLVQAVTIIPRISWEDINEARITVGTLMATRLNIWIAAGGRPEPHPPRWRMDRVFRLVWTDQEASTGHLEFIPAPERLRGFRSHPRLEDNARQGTFTIHPALRRVIDTPGPVSLKDDLADRLNGIRINDSDKGTLGTGTTRGFRLYASRPRPPNRNRVPAQVAPPQDPPIPGSFWKDFWKQKMPHNARNVWWRLLIKKLPSGVRLHRMIPVIVGPLCRICQEGDETDQHLLFSCPRKLEI